MARWLAAALLALTAAACSGRAEPPPFSADWPGWPADSVARLVDPFIGTHGDGNTFPGATTPWGLTAPSPHSRRVMPSDLLGGGHLAGAGYVDDDPQLYGFGLTHLSGTGCPDLGAPVVAAVSGAVHTVDPDHYAATRGEEHAWPGYYSAELVEPGVRVETTATPHGAAFRFFARRDDVTILVDAARSLSLTASSGRVHVVSRRELEGEAQTGGFCLQANHQKVYFVARFDRDAAAAGTWLDDAPGAAPDAEGSAGGWFRFAASSGRTVELVVGVSYVSVDGARANLEAELAGRPFDELRLAAQAAWDDALGRIRVEGATDGDRTIFYTALYHALLHPSLASDVDGGHLRFGGGGVVDHDVDHPRYHVFGLWDTYRALHPLLALVYPDLQRAMARSLAEMTLEAGAPPMWELAGTEVQMMVGDPADIVLADAAQKGLLDADLGRAAWPVLQAAALDVASTRPHRPGNASYRALGYVPIEDEGALWGSVSTTLEYAVADDALGRLGAALGVAVDPSLAVGAGSWRNLVDPATQLFRPRHRDGSFVAPFDPDAVDGVRPQPRSGGPGFVEGSAWNYAFFVPHDVAGHAAATGGDDAYVARLQSLFDSDRFVLWNEPDMAFPYLFTHLAGQGWRTAAAVRDARARFFSSAHDGLPGNDDTGTLSAWYVWSALGLYPDVPAGDDYALGTPLFDRATLALPGGSFVIDAPHPSPSAVYVRRATFGGHDVGERVRFADVAAGGTLSVELADQP